MSADSPLTQYCSFYLADRLCGFDVQLVQEVAKNILVTPIPLAPPYIRGLINLRGQIAVSVDLRALFGLPPIGPHDEIGNIVCRHDGILMSFLVDRVGEVLEVSSEQVEATPDTIAPHLAGFIRNICKREDSLLTVIDLEAVTRALEGGVRSLANEEMGARAA